MTQIFTPAFISSTSGSRAYDTALTYVFVYHVLTAAGILLHMGQAFLEMDL